MLEFIDFVTQNWILVALWLIFLVWLVMSESARGGKTVSPQQATTMINTQDAVVVDVRKPEEFAKGHVPHSINIPAAKIKDRMSELNKHKDKPIIVVCNSGQTSGASGAELRKGGFEPVYRMKGGVMEWQNSRMPLVRK